MSFTQVFVDKRINKRAFFEQINKIIKWHQIDAEIRKYYSKGNSADGRKSYSSLVLFKICLLQCWYGLSDYEVEAQIKDTLSFSYFVGIGFEDDVPDHSVISRFRTTLTKAKAWDNILRAVNKQLEEHEIIVKKGVIVDASITDSLRKPKGRKTIKVEVDRAEHIDEAERNVSKDTSINIEGSCSAEKPNVIVPSKGVDTEAGWIKKQGKLRYGYKKHVMVDDKEGLVLGIVSTPANKSDVNQLENVLATCPLNPSTRVSADKGYPSKANAAVLRKLKLKNRLMYKKEKNKPLEARKKQINSAISKYRYKIERSFGSIKLMNGGRGTARYIGLERTHSQHVLESLSYNLYRAPKIYIKNKIAEQQKLIAL